MWKSQFFHQTIYITVDAERILHFIISGKSFVSVPELDSLVSLDSKFHCTALDFRCSAVAWKVSSCELDHLACSAGSNVVLVHPREVARVRECRWCFLILREGYLLAMGGVCTRHPLEAMSRRHVQCMVFHVGK
jgi:hypothetical protein